MGKTFQQNCSSENYTTAFLRVKKREEETDIDFRSDNTEQYNDIFSIRELNQAIENSHNTTPGPDDVNYTVIKQLPNETLIVLLELFNKIWKSGYFPSLWRDACIIPIPKPGKDSTVPNNYRPISLTSCMCKTLERMVTTRLMWYLEKHQLLTDIQSGFRKQRSTVDHLIRLEAYIRDTFARKEHAVTVFFDLEKAYDTAWNYGALRDLNKMGLRGRLPQFIANFLKNRKFKVKLGQTFSEYYEQEEGFPQGSILSIILFLIKINSIKECLRAETDGSLFVDDFAMSFRGKNMNLIERHLQHRVDALQTWADKNGFKFSTTKTVCVHFCNKRRVCHDPKLLLNNNVIPVVKETKFLGLTFDSRLSFIPHIKKLKTKCQKALNLIRVVSAHDWGADRQTKIMLYRSLVRSRLDYGSMVYGSARPSYLKMLEPIQNQGLRISLNAFRTSPSDSLHVEANELPLDIRRNKLSMQYAVKVYSNKDNPIHQVIFGHNHIMAYEQNTNIIPPFGIRIKPHLEAAGIRLEYIADLRLSERPPWKLSKPYVIKSLANTPKQETNPAIFKAKFNEIRENWIEYENLYTDGSKCDAKASAAVVSKTNTFSCRLPDGASIFSAEAKALQLALRIVKISRYKKFIVFTDSMSVLQAFEGHQITNQLILDLVEKYEETLSLNKTVIFCWIPSHVDITGNEKADQSAKEALNKQSIDMLLPYSD